MNEEKQPPYSLALVLCDAIYQDTISGKPTLLGCFSVLHAREFPARHASMAAYAAITDGRGTVSILFRLVDVDEEAEPLFEGTTEVEFRDPRAVIELQFH